MPRYVAFLRGVMPTTASMPELRRSFEHAGFKAVRTVRSSGNVIFDAAAESESVLEQRAEAAMRAVLGRVFHTIVRSSAQLRALLATDPYAEHDVPPGAKRVVSFLREPRHPQVPLPHSADGATLLALRGREAFSGYEPSPRGPVFMKLIAQAFGDDVTTRT